MNRAGSKKSVRNELANKRAKQTKEILARNLTNIELVVREHKLTGNIENKYKISKC